MKLSDREFKYTSKPVTYQGVDINIEQQQTDESYLSKTYHQLGSLYATTQTQPSVVFPTILKSKLLAKPNPHLYMHMLTSVIQERSRKGYTKAYVMYNDETEDTSIGLGIGLVNLMMAELMANDFMVTTEELHGDIEYTHKFVINF